MIPVEQIDYLAIGHICHDLTAEGLVMGGSAAYATSVAHALGCRSAVLTSSAAEDTWRQELPGIEVRRVVAPQTTLFENVYRGEARHQVVHAVAGRLTKEDLPDAWRRAAIVHLAPIANEVDPDLIDLFSNSLVGLTPQGWMRRWDATGRVYAADWPDAERLLPLAAVTFISEEDLPHAADVERFAALAPLLVRTAGAAGCTVYWNGEERSFPAVATPLVDPTGAGDCFAAAYLVRLLQTGGDPWESARFANVLAAQTIGQRGIPAKVRAIREQLVTAGANKS